jgi:hypothetical protein
MIAFNFWVNNCLPLPERTLGELQKNFKLQKAMACPTTRAKVTVYPMLASMTYFYTGVFAIFGFNKQHIMQK